MLGRFTPSFILARDNRRTGKYYGGTTEYLRVLFPGDDGTLSNSGMFVPANEKYFSKFGQGDYEQALDEAQMKPLRSRRDPDVGMIDGAPDLGVSRIMPLRGMASPRQLRQHPHLMVA